MVNAWLSLTLREIGEEGFYDDRIGDFAVPPPRRLLSRGQILEVVLAAARDLKISFAAPPPEISESASTAELASQLAAVFSSATFNPSAGWPHPDSPGLPTDPPETMVRVAGTAHMWEVKSPGSRADGRFEHSSLRVVVNFNTADPGHIKMFVVLVNDTITTDLTITIDAGAI